MLRMNALLMTIFMDWDLTTFLNNATAQLKTWGGALICLVGIVMIIVAVVQIARKFIAPQGAPGGWAMPIVCFIIGGALLAGGWSMVASMAKGGQKTLEDLGGKTTEDTGTKTNTKTKGTIIAGVDIDSLFE